ncbi:TP53BP1 isoform 13, partial [Pan troglodytes]
TMSVLSCICEARQENEARSEDPPTTPIREKKSLICLSLHMAMSYIVT